MEIIYSKTPFRNMKYILHENQMFAIKKEEDKIYKITAENGKIKYERLEKKEEKKWRKKLYEL